MSIDGYLGSAPSRRLELSNDAPRLLVRSKTRRDERTARGLAPSPIKVTVTERVELDACADFFTTGETEKLVYCASPRFVDARSRLGSVATVVDGGQRVEMRRLRPYGGPASRVSNGLALPAQVAG